MEFQATLPLGHVLSAVALAFAAAVSATAFHFEMLSALARYVDRHSHRPRLAVAFTIAGILAAHIAEIALYAVAFALAIGPFALGTFRGMTRETPLALFYSAAEAYSSLGYGDVAPSGSMRLVASIASLNGIILLAWSGSFLFMLVQRWHRT